MGLNCFLVKAPGNQLQQEDSVVEGVRGGRDSSSLFALSCSGSILLLRDALILFSMLGHREHL